MHEPGASSGAAGAVARPRPRKDLAIESLRGLALLLMVAGHVIGRTADRGLQVPDDSAWRFAYLALADMRMPLFTFLSGYVFALRPPIVGREYAGLVRGKARRVLLPLVTVGTLLFAMLLLVPGTNFKPDPASWWRTYVYGFEHLWFLQAIFVVFLVVGLLEVAGVLQRRRGWLGAFVASLVVMWLLALPGDANVFSLNEAAYLLPFFLLGYGISRHRPAEPRALVVALGAAALVVLAVRLLAQTDAWDPAPWVTRALGIGVGITAVLFLYAARRFFTFRALYWLGPFSFGVYLLHPFGTSAARMALGIVGVYSYAVVFVCAMVVGIAAPIVAQRVTRLVPPVHTALFGEKVRPRHGAGTSEESRQPQGSP